METIKIKYHVDGLEPIVQQNTGEWYDLRSAETVQLKKSEFKLVNLGVSIALPDGYEAILAPRSSTFKNFGLLMTNSFGVIDNKFSGDQDIWLRPVFATRDVTINKNDRICQFRIQPMQPVTKIVPVENMETENRGGLGSTGVK